MALRSRGVNSQQSVTVNYKHDTTGYIESGENIFNISYKGIFDIAKWLRATVSINGIYDKTKDAGTTESRSYYNVPSYYSLFNADGTTAWSNPTFGFQSSPVESDSNLKTMKYRRS